MNNEEMVDLYKYLTIENCVVDLRQYTVPELMECIKKFKTTYFNLKKHNLDMFERIDKAIEYIEFNDESLYTFEPDYDYEEELVDNYEPSNYREDLLEILKGDSNGV